MSIKQLEKTIMIDVKAALGCTEPITIALATAFACRQIESPIKKIEIRLSTNLFKNAMEVGIPGTHGERGIYLAAALGCYAKKAKPDLTLLEGVDENWLRQAKSLIENNCIKLDLASGIQGLFVEVRAQSNSGYGRAIIKGSHENLTLLEKNGEIILSAEDNKKKQTDEILVAREALAHQNFSIIWNCIEQLSETTRQHLIKGVQMNLKVAEAGKGKDGFLQIGNIYDKLIQDGWLGNDIVNKAKVLTSAAVDARMSGCELPVMTSAGSGNQGLSITLPLYSLATHLKSSEAKLTEALAISHGITSILKHHTGTLSAMCGCVVCSGTGLTAGAIYLLDGNLEMATSAINNMVGSITGIICDGAKVGCAIKLVCAVDSAFQAALMARQGLKLPTSNGVLGSTLEESLLNIGKIAAPGMIETDDQILSIMLGKPY
jgi:L-cysteine desulfidase